MLALRPPTLFNRMQSAWDITNSVIGPNGASVGNSTFAGPVKFGNGRASNYPGGGSQSSRVNFACTPAMFTPTEGCIETWVYADYVPLGGGSNFGVYGFFNMPYIQDTPCELFWLGYYAGTPSYFGLSVDFGGTRQSIAVASDAIVGAVGTVGTPQTPTTKLFHIAGVWKSTGIAGSGKTMRIYINGVPYDTLQSGNNTGYTWGNTSPTITIPCNCGQDSGWSTRRYLQQNLKLYNYAKINFEDINNERDSMLDRFMII